MLLHGEGSRRAAVATSFLLVAAACQVPELVPQEQMTQLGASAWQDMLAKTPQVNDPQVTSFVEKVAQRVVDATELRGQKVDVAVFQSDQVNAFALPGGHIGVYSGILPVAQNGAGLAAVLSHEVAHVLNHHANERMSEQMITEAALGAAGTALQNNQHRDTILSALGIGSQLGVTLPYTRSQESEADLDGLKIMAKAGYDPREAVQLWNRMKQAEQGGEPPAFLSDHPSISTRINDLQTEMNKALAIYRQTSPQYGQGQPVPAD